MKDPNQNRIDPTPVRLSTNMSIDRQTPKRDFGELVSTTANAVANGAAIASGLLPGGAILSAAVSSVTQMGGHNTPTSGNATSAAYSAATGAVSIPGQGGGLNTTVGAGGGTVGSTGGVSSTVPGGVNYGGSGGTIGQMNSELMAASQENSKLLQLQIAMQRENQTFTTVSNVLKVRHETTKNSISNVR